MASIFVKFITGVSNYKGKVKSKSIVAKKQPQAPLSSEVKQLQAELRKAKLHAEVLEEMLRLSEGLTGIDLRKKFGAKR